MTKEALQALLDSMTLEEKTGQLVQCNAGQFITNSMATVTQIKDPDSCPTIHYGLYRYV